MRMARKLSGSQSRVSRREFAVQASLGAAACSYYRAESVINAVAIYKKLRSRSSFKAMRTEYLYVIQSPNLNGLAIYSKGKLVKEAGEEIYYFLVSSKKAL
jgi:hypothetical protein